MYLVLLAAPPPARRSCPARFIIHAGQHKTGSTYVQTWLLDSRDVLHANDVADKSGCAFVEFEIFGTEAYISNNTRIWIQAEAVAKSLAPRAILASECFDRDGSDWKSRRAKNHGKADGFLRAFRQRLADLYARVTVVFVYRQPRTAHLVSVYGWELSARKINPLKPEDHGHRRRTIRVFEELAGFQTYFFCAVVLRELRCDRAIVFGHQGCRRCVRARRV